MGKMNAREDDSRKEVLIKLWKRESKEQMVTDLDLRKGKSHCSNTELQWSKVSHLLLKTPWKAQELEPAGTSKIGGET